MNQLQQVPPHSLNYAPRRQATAWLVRHARRLVGLAAVVSLSILAYQVWPRLEHRVLWLYWFRQCEKYRAAANTELAIGNPIKAKLLVANNHNYLMSHSGYAVYCPYPFQHFLQLDERCNAVVDKEDPSTSQIIFVGGMKRPDGLSRLVIISGDTSNADDMLFCGGALILEKPSIFQTLPRPPAYGAGGTGGDRLGPWLEIRVDAGFTDPRDSSHITFPYSFDRPADEGGSLATGTIDAYLTNKDSLKFVANGADAARIRFRETTMKSAGPTGS